MRYIFMTEIIYIIFVAFSEIEDGIGLMKKKSFFSWIIVIDTLANFQIGIASGISGLICLLFINENFDYYYLIPLGIMAVILFLLEKCAKKKLLKSIHKEPTFSAEGINITTWLVIGVCSFVISALCAFGGLFLLFWSIGRLPS